MKKMPKWSLSALDPAASNCLFSYCCCPWLAALWRSSSISKTSPAELKVLTPVAGKSQEPKMSVEYNLQIDGLEWSIMDAADADSVTEFLLSHFFTEEPLGKALNIDVEAEIRPWLAKMVAHQIREEISVVVRDVSDHNRLVAVCLNDVERNQPDPDDVTIFTSVQPDQHPSMWMIIQLLEELVKDVDLFQRYQIDAYVVLQILSVSPRYGGRGLAKKLIDLTELLSQKKRFKLIMSEATSSFSASAFVKAGYTSEKSIDYSTYSVEGTEPFRNTGLHKGAQLMIKLI